MYKNIPKEKGSDPKAKLLKSLMLMSFYSEDALPDNLATPSYLISPFSKHSSVSTIIFPWSTGGDLFLQLPVNLVLETLNECLLR